MRVLASILRWTGGVLFIFINVVFGFVAYAAVAPRGKCGYGEGISALGLALCYLALLIAWKYVLLAVAGVYLAGVGLGRLTRQRSVCGEADSAAHREH